MTHIIYYSPGLARGAEGQTYTQQTIDLAIIKALDLLQAGTQIGADKFPQAYNKYPYFHAEHATAPIFEFPLGPGDVYDGSSPASADRVVFGSVAKDFSSASYVAVATVKENGVRFLNLDLSLNGKTGVGEPFSEAELGTHGPKEVLSPPTDVELVEADTLDVAFQN